MKTSRSLVQKSEWNYGFKVWIVALLGPLLFNIIRYFVAYNHIIQYQLLFNAITLLLAIPLSVFPLLLFNYTVKKVYAYSLHIINKKLLLSVSYFLCLAISAAIPLLCIAWDGDSMKIIIDIGFMGLGLNTAFGFAAVWLFKLPE